MARNSHGYGSDFVVKGFLDSNSDALDQHEGYPPILGDIKDYDIQSSDVFVCAIEDVVRRQYCYELIAKRGGQLYTLIHQSCVIADGVQVGKGCILSYDVIVSNDTTIGDRVLINTRAVIGHDCAVGSDCSIGVMAFVAGGVDLSDMVTVHAAARIHKGTFIGRRASVGMSTTVLRDVEEGVTVFGTPARVIFDKK